MDNLHYIVNFWERYCPMREETFEKIAIGKRPVSEGVCYEGPRRQFMYNHRDRRLEEVGVYPQKTKSDHTCHDEEIKGTV